MSNTTFLAFVLRRIPLLALSVTMAIASALHGEVPSESEELAKIKRMLRSRNPEALGEPAREAPSTPMGVTFRKEGAYEGLLLVSPLRDTSSFLVDIDGTVHKTWSSSHRPGLSAYLTPDWGMIRASSTERLSESGFALGGGVGGSLEIYDSAGRLKWSYSSPDKGQCLHHDAIILDSGNVLAIAWASVSREEAIAAGRSPEDVFGDELWYTRILEIEPIEPEGGKVVWQWDAWDHIVQNRDPGKPNYGEPSESPHKIDLNYFRRPSAGSRPVSLESAPRRSPNRRANVGEVDWMHANSIDLHPETGHLLVSVHGFDEIWAIDRGRPDKGLVYRFGNPAAYGAGEFADRYLFRQHDANWIPDGFPGSGNVLVFSNGERDGENSRSRVIEARLPLENGEYRRNERGFFEKPEIVWEYSGKQGEPFSALRMSGAHRLPNGNTLITDGPAGRIIQVAPSGGIVWEYWNEFGNLPDLANARRRATDAGGQKSVFKCRMYPIEALAR